MSFSSIGSNFNSGEFRAIIDEVRQGINAAVLAPASEETYLIVSLKSISETAKAIQHDEFMDALRLKLGDQTFQDLLTYVPSNAFKDMFRGVSESVLLNEYANHGYSLAFLEGDKYIFKKEAKPMTPHPEQRGC